MDISEALLSTCSSHDFLIDTSVLNVTMNLCHFVLKFRNFTHHVSWLGGFHYSLILLCVLLQVKKKKIQATNSPQKLVKCFLFYNPLLYTALLKQLIFYYYFFLHLTLPLNLPIELSERNKQKGEDNFWCLLQNDGEASSFNASCYYSYKIWEAI